MSNQESQNQGRTEEQAGVEKRRRFIKGAAVATPVILTLASPSVFGQVMCLSQQMSGNMSGTTTGSCVKGASPGAWKNLGGTIGSDSTIDAWNKTGFVYGAYIGVKALGGKNVGKNYTGGTPFNDTTAFGSGRSDSMRQIMCDNPGSDSSMLVAALLNAKYFAGTYVLTPAEVIGLWNGSIPVPPGYSSLNAFLDSTWI